MKKGILGFLLILQGMVSMAAENKTKLIVGITVSNFYPEWVTIYKNDLAEGGLKRICGQGREMMADYRYLYSQTGVDQATIYTGLLPSEHGVIASRLVRSFERKAAE